jgi:multiple sugar transport system permease protein
MPSSGSATADLTPQQEGTFTLWRKALRQATKERWGDPWGYVFVLPAVAMFAVFNAWPILRGLTMAFQDYRFILQRPQPFNGISNFVEAANDPIFWASLGRSFLFVLLCAPANILIALAVATLIANVWHPTAAGIYRMVSYLPVILPITVAMLLWRQFFNGQYGYLNYAIKGIFGPDVSPGWTSDPTLVMPAMAIAAIWKNTGYNILMFLIGLYALRGEVYEAAAIDGATSWQSFIHITLPLLKPVFALVLVLMTGAISVTQEPLIWFPSTSGSAGPENSALTAGYYAYKVAFLYGDLRWGYGAAINLVLGLLSMMGALAVFRFLRYERLM